MGSAFLAFLIAVWRELSPPTSARGGRLGSDREGIFHQDHVTCFETLPARHDHDFCHLHPLQAGGEPGLGNDRGYADGGHFLLGLYLIYVREDCPQPGLGRDGTRGPSPGFSGGDVPPQRRLGALDGDDLAAGSDLRDLPPPDSRPPQERAGSRNPPDR